jgi:hypothetical protein
VPAYEVAHRSIFSGRLVDDAVSVSSWGTWWGGAANSRMHAQDRGWFRRCSVEDGVEGRI